MIAMIVPAHNEEECIEECVKSLVVAARYQALNAEQVEIFVVLDACSDRTGSIARQLGARTVDVHVRNVGVARHAGAQLAIESGARWLSFTDADSVVAPDWLASQLALDSDAVCGTVAVDCWGSYGERMRKHFSLTYTDADGHSHVHGANLGISTAAYLDAGGFAGLETGEDVALVDELRRQGARIAWSRAPRVVTSVRSDFKAPGGFGATLKRIEELGHWACGQPASVA